MYNQLEWNILHTNDLYERKLNPYIVQWFLTESNRQMVKELEIESNQRDFPRDYFLANVRQYVDSSVIEKYNKLQRTTLYALQWHTMVAAHKLFFEWRKHFYTYCRVQEDKSYLLNWRGTWQFKDSNYNSHLSLDTQIVLPDWKRFGLVFNFGGEEFFQVIVHALLFSIYLTIDSKHIWNLIKKLNLQKVFQDEKTLGLNIHHGCIWLYLFRNEGGYLNRRCYSFDLIDFLLGMYTYNHETLSTENITIALPEGNYKGTASITKETWSRERFTFKKKEVIKCEIEVPEGITVPGKGDNDWDQGDSKTYSLSFPHSGGIDEAVDYFTKSILNRRYNVYNQ